MCSLSVLSQALYHCATILKADTFFLKTKVIYSLDMLSYYIFAVFAFQNCLLWYAETKRQTCIQEKLRLITCGILYPP